MQLYVTCKKTNTMLVDIFDETNASEGSSKPYKFWQSTKFIKTTQMLGLIRNLNIVLYNLNLGLHVLPEFKIIKKFS